MKQTVSEEIVAYMERHGITHRAPKQVWMKMVNLGNSFETATNWLVATGHYDDFQRGNATDEVRKQLGKRCRYYDELAPVFTRGAPADIAPSESSNETVSDAGQHDPSQEQVTAGEVNDNSTVTESAGGLYSQLPHVSMVQGITVRPHGGDTKPKGEDYSRSLQKLELESKKAQLRADIVCSTALNRKKMLDAGIDLKEVNRVLPQ
ncbi:hypothetical protein PR001_g25423 [Phytophthora rubi]|uniref:Uncharacterized protein n=1 Tax=Phytophthora rubi TaxID=129364 RepID=A0A6A3IE75_9STRA|nr:hypothetical protein PR001_g25423 [Phytophthora rubi]KAE8978668.1 hypothetical protein PR002_g24651 [Phytophthora rubi]